MRNRADSAFLDNSLKNIMAVTSRIKPYRIQLLNTQNGWCVYDQVWSWPVDTQAEGVAALVQSTRQLARELGAGEVLRLLIEIPIAPAASIPASPARSTGLPDTPTNAFTSMSGGNTPIEKMRILSTPHTQLLTNSGPIKLVLMEALLVVHWSVIAVLFYDYADAIDDPVAADASCAKLGAAVAAMFLNKFGEPLESTISAAETSRDSASIVARFRETCMADMEFISQVAEVLERGPDST